ncbi:MAG: DNA polymerase III subunit epsilon [Pseudomonadota bacterium]
MRQIVLDTETTGLDVADGHRVIEIGAVEIINRSVTDHYYHQYLNPERDIDAGAQEVHGISSEFLSDKPKFKDVYSDFLEFIGDSELIIHNAPFDVGFLNHELTGIDHDVKQIEDHCSVFDTLIHARKLHPGQRNSLDALCKRYEIDNSHRELHGALLDAQILADVYLAMTGGQVSLSLNSESSSQQKTQKTKSTKKVHDLQVITATQEETAEHEKLLMHIAQNNQNQKALWTFESDNEH